MTDTASHHNSGLNQQIYQRLRAALELNLRRQIFVAVCDDLSLRNQLATKLHAELAYPAQIVAAQRTEELPYPRLVSLNLSLENPDPMDQVAFWLEQNPPPQGSHLLQAPGFQLLGVERLTRQPPTVQRLFLSNLQRIEQMLPTLESSLLLWIPRPWSRVIQQSAPEFWRWHTGVFEFEGEPTPVPTEAKGGSLEGNSMEPAVALPTAAATQAPAASQPPLAQQSPVPAKVAAPAKPPVLSETIAVADILTTATGTDVLLLSSLPSPANSQHPVHRPSAVQNTECTNQPASEKQTADPVTAAIASQPGRLTPAQKESLWNILTHDLSQLDEPESQAQQSIAPPPPPVVPPPPVQPTNLHTLETKKLEVQKQDQSPQKSLKTAFTVPQPQQQLRRTESASPAPLATPPNQAAKLLGAPSAPAKPSPSVPPTRPLKAPDTAAPVAAKGSATAKSTDTTQTSDHALKKEKPRPAFTQSQSALDLADFVLASITQENQTEPVSNNGYGAVGPVATNATNGHKTSLQPLQALENIEQLHLKQAPPAALAAAYRNLGNLYRDRIEQGHASQQNLMISIRSYEQALDWLDESSSLWSDILNDIGNLYWMLSHSPNRGDNALRYLEKGIQAYQTALSKTNPDTRSHSYAMIQNNLGSAYGDLARYRDSSEHLQRSIQAYQEALRYRDANSEPQRYAATQNNLGTAYWNLAQHEKPIVNLSQAIAAYNQALHHYDPDREPLSYAMIQNNLGTAYWNLAQFEQNTPELAGALDASSEDFLRLAIGAYRVALIYRTAEVNPTAYAATQNNLGTAYWHLANQPTLHYEECGECLQAAIVAYKAALETVQQISTKNSSLSLSFDRFATHNNLGLALHQLAIDKHIEWEDSIRTTYLEEALQHHVQALQGWQGKPDFYQTALGYIVQTIRTFYNLYGISGQTSALSKVPGSLLSEILSKL